MKETSTKAKKTRGTLRAEYDFSGGVRGRFAAAHQRGSNVVVLEPDVARKFRTSKAVNDALRTVLRNGK